MAQQTHDPLVPEKQGAPVIATHGRIPQRRKPTDMEVLRTELDPSKWI